MLSSLSSLSALSSLTKLPNLLLTRPNHRTVSTVRLTTLRALAAFSIVMPFSASMAAPFNTLFAFSDEWQIVIDSDYIEAGKSDKDSMALLIQTNGDQSYNSDLTPGGLDDTQTHYEFEMMDESDKTLPLTIDLIKSSCQYKNNILPWSANIKFNGQSFAACASPTLEVTANPAS